MSIQTLIIFCYATTIFTRELGIPLKLVPSTREFREVQEQKATKTHAAKKMPSFLKAGKA